MTVAIAMQPPGNGAAPPGRIPPQNLDAERSVLGGVLLDDTQLPGVREVLAAADFYREAHRKVFEAMCSLGNRAAPIDRVTLKDELDTLGTYEAAGGEDFIDALDTLVPSGANVAYYARIVQDTAVQRRVIEAAHAIASQGYAQGGDAAELVADARLALEKATASVGTSFDRAWRDLTEEDVNTPPPPQDFMLAPYIPAGKVSVLSGPGGGAKTTLTVYTAICRALRLPLFDNGPTPTAGHTVFVSAEDGIDDYRRKLNAWRLELEEMGHRWDAKMIADRIRFMDLSGESLRLIEGHAGQYQQTGAVAQLASTIKRRCPHADWIIVETLSRVTGGAEGNEANSIVIEAGQTLAKLTGGSAVTFVGHVSQDAGRRGEADQYAGRGGSALGDNARSSMVLTYATADNLKRYMPGARVPDADRDRVLLFRHSKSNGPQADPILVEKWRTQAGMVLRPYGASVASSKADPARFDRLKGIVAILRKTEGEATRRALRGYKDDLGTSRDGVDRLVTEAVEAGHFTFEKRTGKGGGMQLVPASPKEQPEPPQREDLA